ncbi:3-keto steroid reductase-like protein [Coniochaeta sp. PMI_546]|nr:3-keto steroid reductase-like protein [Coniochaeta sp. PMI_546]
MAAPWDSLPPEKTLFALVTGANSGIGFGICQRLIDEFIASRSLDSHLILIPTARSSKKSEDTVNALRKYAAKTAETSKTLKSRLGPGYQASETTRRIHLLSVQLDLCNLPSIKKAADQLVNGTLTSHSADDAFQSLVDVRIPRLDAVILNAGIGGWSGLDWALLAHNVFTEGIVQATTFPTFKAGIRGLTVNPIPESKADDKTSPTLGEVFCANVFGHYLFAHAILPLLSREPSSTVPPGRIIWESSVEPTWRNLSLSDFQGVKSKEAYESSKRLTDVLALTSSLPSVKPYSLGFLSPPSSKDQRLTPPKIYLAHPGVVVSTIFPLNAFLFFWYRLVMYLSRLLGSPWHTVTAYKGACAMVWLALAGEDEIAARGGQKVKWGSSCDRWGNTSVKKTEVEGWGWEGKVEDRDALAHDDSTGVLRKMVGRRSDAVDLTEEKRAQFEELGVECWKEMERLRAEWEGRMDF